MHMHKLSHFNLESSVNHGVKSENIGLPKEHCYLFESLAPVLATEFLAQRGQPDGDRNSWEPAPPQ